MIVESMVDMLDQRSLAKAAMTCGMSVAEVIEANVTSALILSFSCGIIPVQHDPTAVEIVQAA